MKKVIPVVALVLCLVGSVSAQVKDQFTAGTSLSDALTIVTERGHISGPKLDPGVKIEGLKLEFDVPINKSDTTLELAKRVLPIGYTPYFDPTDGALRIRRAENRPAARPTTPPPGPITSDDAAAISERTHRLMLGDRAYEAGLAQNQAARGGFGLVEDPAVISERVHIQMLGMSTLTPRGFDPRDTWSNSRFDRAGYSGPYWYGLPFYDLYYKDAARRQESVWSTGLVKFKGRKRGRDEKFLEKVSVVACMDPSCSIDQQVNIIDAAEGNNKWDADVAVPIGPDGTVTLLFVYEDGSDVVRAFSRRVWLQPMAVRSKSTPIIVQQEQLDRARIRYNLKTHLLVENDEGDIDEK